MEGDAARLADLTRAIHGQEIVISTRGGMDLDAKTANIARAMNCPRPSMPGTRAWSAETSPAIIGRFVADFVKEPQRYANRNLGISQPNTDGDRPAAYRRPSLANARRTDLPA